MPAASCRIMPARNIRRCDTISASFGFSFRIGRKNRDNRMATLEESVKTREASSETGSVAKTQGRGPAKSRLNGGFLSDLPTILTVANKAQTRPNAKPVAIPSMHRHIQFVFQRDLLKIGHQRVDPHVPTAGIGDRHAANMPIAIRAAASRRAPAVRCRARAELRVKVASLAGSRLPSPAISCSTKLSVPTLPGEIRTWNMAFSVWIWMASGVTAAAASARGGGVKRQPATTAKNCHGHQRIRLQSIGPEAVCSPGDPAASCGVR